MYNIYFKPHIAVPNVPSPCRIYYPQTVQDARQVHRFYIYQFKGPWPKLSAAHGNSKVATYSYTRMSKEDQEKALELLRTLPPRQVYHMMDGTSLRNPRQLYHLRMKIAIENNTLRGTGHHPKDNVASQYGAIVKLIGEPSFPRDKFWVKQSTATDTECTIVLLNKEACAWVAQMMLSDDDYVPVISIDAVRSSYQSNSN